MLVVFSLWLSATTTIHDGATLRTASWDISLAWLKTDPEGALSTFTCFPGPCAEPSCRRWPCRTCRRDGFRSSGKGCCRGGGRSPPAKFRRRAWNFRVSYSVSIEGCEYARCVSHQSDSNALKDAGLAHRPFAMSCGVHTPAFAWRTLSTGLMNSRYSNQLW